MQYVRERIKRFMNSQNVIESPPRVSERKPKIKKVILNDKFAKSEI